MSTTKQSVERTMFHICLEKFKKYLKKDDVVYDIGKSETLDYKDDFEGYKYSTIDRDEGRNPDYVIDAETDRLLTLPPPHALILNGVAEQCDNPIKLMENISELMSERMSELMSELMPVKRYVLFGVISVGFPLYERDYFRFTPNGMYRLLERLKFKILEENFCYRNKILSYMYFITEKK